MSDTKEIHLRNLAKALVDPATTIGSLYFIVIRLLMSRLLTLHFFQLIFLIRSTAIVVLNVCDTFFGSYPAARSHPFLCFCLHFFFILLSSSRIQLRVIQFIVSFRHNAFSLLVQTSLFSGAIKKKKKTFFCNELVAESNQPCTTITPVLLILRLLTAVACLLGK